MEEILRLVVESYIDQTKPISSSYLCKRYNLPYSSATVRNCLESLEKLGYLSHLHTSSGRVPTKAGFRRYVELLNEQKVLDEYAVDTSGYHPPHEDVDALANYSLDVLAQISGYTSMMVVSSPRQEKIFAAAQGIF